MIAKITTGFKISSTYEPLCLLNFGAFVGDNMCDDYLNKEECDFDGGDCCNWKANQNLCSQCLCHIPGYHSTEPITGM